MRVLETYSNEEQGLIVPFNYDIFYNRCPLLPIICKQFELYLLAMIYWVLCARHYTKSFTNVLAHLIKKIT